MNRYEGLFELVAGEGPVVAAAIHNGHFVRPLIARYLALSEDERLREEDPFTSYWTSIAPTRLIGLRSRFEFDLNRPRQLAVYLEPEHAWGLNVWKQALPQRVIEHSLAQYDMFYDAAEATLKNLLKRHSRVVVLDLHTYNHRRDGRDAAVANAEENPEINIGTGSMNRSLWAPIVDGFISDLRERQFLGRQLDVRENVKFRGGHFSRWIHETFPESVCAIAIEVKKFFMDEWSGECDLGAFRAVHAALRSTVPGMLQRLEGQSSGRRNPIELEDTQVELDVTALQHADHT